MDDGDLILNTRAALNAAAREDLHVFFSLVFPYIEPETTFRDAPHFQVLAEAFENVLSGKTPRLLVAVPPRFGKSMLGSVALPAWALGRQPGTKIICASYVDQLSRGFAQKTRDVMVSDAYRSIFPGVGFEHGGNALEELRTSSKGYRLATSVGGMITGKGANLVIIDDPIKAVEAESDLVRQGVYDWLKGSIMSRFDLGEPGRMIVIMQRLHQDDLIGRLRDDSGWAMLEMPARAYQAVSYSLGGGKSWTLKPGELLYPAGFNEAAYAERRSSMSEASFNAQFQQRPDAAEGTLFKLKQFRRYDHPPHDHQTELIVQSWDLALSEESTGAFSVCTTWAIWGLKLYLLDVFRKKMEFPRLAYAVRQLQKKHHADFVILETTGIGKAVYQDARKDPDLAGKLVHHDPKLGKVERATMQVPKIERRRVHLPKAAPWLEVFEAEVAAFPLSKYADQVDSMVQFLRALDSSNQITINLSAYEPNQMSF